MRVDDFAYSLPENLIAAHPTAKRDDSRLMIVHPAQLQSFETRTFHDLPKYLRPGDLLVMNDTRVIPARLFAQRLTGGKVEFLLLKEEADSTPAKPRWRTLLRPAKKIPIGEAVAFENGEHARVITVHDGGARTVEFSTANFRSLLATQGRMPIPPYILKQRETESEGDVAEDRERYQTVYAKDEGSVAAPTAGLHFTKELLQAIRAAGIGTAFVTLHVGAGTFQTMDPGTEVENHVMHEEQYIVPAETAEAVARAKSAGGRIIAVGTTTARTLESAWNAEANALNVGPGETRMMIIPGSKLQVVDGLVTNFHLPRSTLLLLVSAIAGANTIKLAYAEAVRRRYRFFSYGDAMLIIE